jgi:hypothetical protein
MPASGRTLNPSQDGDEEHTSFFIMSGHMPPAALAARVDLRRHPQSG